MRRASLVPIACGTLLFMVLVASSATAGGGCLAGTDRTEGSGVSVALQSCSFAPVILRAPEGAAITWKNADYLPHAVSGVGWGQINGALVLPGSTFTQQFAAAGIYPYTCYLHPGMSGVVVVGGIVSQGAAAPSGPSAAAAPDRGLVAGLAAAVALAGASVGYLLGQLRRARNWRSAKPVRA